MTDDPAGPVIDPPGSSRAEQPPPYQWIVGTAMNPRAAPRGSIADLRLGEHQLDAAPRRQPRSLGRLWLLLGVEGRRPDRTSSSAPRGPFFERLEGRHPPLLEAERASIGACVAAIDGSPGAATRLYVSRERPHRGGDRPGAATRAGGNAERLPAHPSVASLRRRRTPLW